MASSPRVGVFRDSMLIRPNIIKAPLGKPIYRGFSIPGPAFTFGVSNSEDQERVAHVHSASSLPPVDFVALNRNAIKSGLITAKELRQYRAQRPPRVQPNTGRQDRRQPITGQGKQGLVPDITYGIISRQDTPLNLLLAHEYGQRWIIEQLERKKTENRRQSTTLVIADTRSSLLRKTQILPQNQTQTLPKTSRYSQVGPALETFRHPKSRTQAMKAQEREAPSRRAWGQGVYNLD
ncbi:hypothetical protein NQD34_007427 [Periophthalmus magnuspinnatus]|nr:hypothetical protein NQD34_007427 [Periophthalmus magnuspinnatus]